ncbi:MAG: patatin family protein [Clostridia bacterium]|nr:patatin family protein [Clostridia bacterium]
MPGLILEGGTFRPIFTAGALDALLAHDLMFDYIIGVSAGISNAFSYVSRQPGRNLEILRRFRNDSRYFGARNLLRCGSVFGLDFMFEDIPRTHLPYDYDTLRRYDGRLRVGVTDARTGAPVYLDGRALDDKGTMLRATCALPLLFPPIDIEGTPYYDGGIADPIPIRRALADGSRKNLIILTRTTAYRKQPTRTDRLAALRVGRRFPALPQVIAQRPKQYNDTLCFVRQLETHHPDTTVVLRPSVPLSSFEKDVAQLEASYRAGYALAESRLDDIRRLFN